MSNQFIKKFSGILLRWNAKNNRRKMPWKGEKDPYKIWLSEIILQQTRVEQGWSYYNKFVSNFPDIHQLARATEKRIYKLWEGLGYYTRCKNLIETAKYISKERAGTFPDTYEDILMLKGVGQYTAAAISSFAYNLPKAVVDGNVFRVLSRVFGLSIPIDSSEGKKYFSKLANDLLDKKKPGIYNQAIMDFGAVICKPVNPLCTDCVFNKHCIAFSKNKISTLPVKQKKLKIQTRWFYYLLIEYKGRVYISKRIKNDIWKNLYEFVLIETSIKSDEKNILKQAIKDGILIKGSFKVQSVSTICFQQLSHQKIYGQFIRIVSTTKISLPKLLSVSKSQLTQYAFPRFINSYLKGLY